MMRHPLLQPHTRGENIGLLALLAACAAVGGYLLTHPAAAESLLPVLRTVLAPASSTP